MKSAKESFTSADSFPVKLFKDVDLVNSIVNNKNIYPIHAQVIPTNECNLACSFCSCSNEDRSLELSYADLLNLTSMLYTLGTKSITITGGGEPLMYRHISDLIQICYERGISTGLVTNGAMLHPIKGAFINKLTWCRISQGDEREPMSEQYVSRLIDTALYASDVDWAFSYVVSHTPDIDRIKRLIALAEMMKCTHVRLVADLLDPDAIPMGKLKLELMPFLQTSKVPVIIQERNKPTIGGRCYIGYLKPVISPDMKVYPCCGVQYALPEKSKKLPESLCLGTVDELPKILRNSYMPIPAAEQCVTCYYKNYNVILESMLSEIKHVEFV